MKRKRTIIPNRPKKNDKYYQFKMDVITTKI